MNTCIRHKLLASNTDILRESGAEHHDLFVMWGCTEDFLDISTHVCKVEKGRGQSDSVVASGDTEGNQILLWTDRVVQAFYRTRPR